MDNTADWAPPEDQDEPVETGEQPALPEGWHHVPHIMVKGEPVGIRIENNTFEGHVYGTLPGEIGYTAHALHGDPHHESDKPREPKTWTGNPVEIPEWVQKDIVPEHIQAANPGRQWLLGQKGPEAVEAAYQGEPVFDAMSAGNASDDLQTWWVAVAHQESGTIAAKMREYGGGGRARDLIEIGRDLYDIAGRTGTEQDYAEAGVYFYLRGKMSRWTAAMMEGRAVSDDTLYDIGVYVRMAQRIRQTGGWPI